MIELEIDGKPIQVAEGTIVIEAANKLGIYVPHFCYHKKLSIAANCRMCLVEVEKAPKPLPACATPATNGMKVHTHSSLAVNAQKGVMEFLLINHPLDCPVCDEGGECQLQDLAVGYGASNSRYNENKRSVPNKFLGPLIATEMTRCIQCTRCVRFGVEIAGIMELGMVGRGEAEEIVTFVGRTVDSELSGNMIDVCPVGALTSKPFRFRARSWELQNKKSVSPHCGLGSNLIVQTKLNRVYRVLPFENEAINETWLSDKDRFSYEGLNSSERLTQPMVKRDGEWRTCDWPQAFTFIASRLQAIRERGGAEHIGALATPYQTLEELYLLQKLVRAIGSGNIDFRLRQCDFALDEKLRGAPWLGMSVASLSELKRVLFVGTNLRKDHPLIAARIRKAEKRGTQVSLINAFDNDLLMPVAHNMIVAPSMMADALAEVVNGSADGLAHPIATNLRETPSAILLGNLAQHHPQSSRLHQLAQQLAQQTGAQFGYLGEAANSVGGYLARATPLAAKPNGLDANNMLARPRRAYLLLGVEPELDCHNPSQAMDAMRQAELVVSMSAYKHRAIEYAHVLLPISPFSETAGTFVNTEGRAQSFNAAAPPLGETRPAWKVLRVIGNHLKLPEFGYDTIEEIRAEVAASKVPLDNTTLHNVPENRFAQAFRSEYRSIERIADVSIYSADAIVRRSPPLQETADARDPVATLRGALMERMGIADGDTVRLTQNGGQAVVIARRDDRLPENCIRVAGGHRLTSDLGSMFGDIAIERVTPEKMAQR